MIFGKSKTIKEIVKVDDVYEEHFKRVDTWLALYSGNNDEFLKYKVTTINGEKNRVRKSLRMAKKVSNELAKLLFTEKVEISVNDKAANEYIKEVFKDNRFYKLFQGKLETMIALGGLVLKAHPEKQPNGTFKIKVKYVTPDSFIPISYDSDEITEGVFLNITKKGDKVYCLFEFHKWEWHKPTDEEGNAIEGELVKNLVITNELYEGDKNNVDVKRVPLQTLYDDLEERVVIENLTQPVFQYIKPNISNNFDLNSPLGISIYANSIDTLFAIDVAFDSFIREFKLGKRRIIIPADAIRTTVDPVTGQVHRYFDADDEVYQAVNYSDPEKQRIVDNTVSLRVDEHIAAINGLLNLLATQTGFSVGTFTFDGKSFKTATEVISERSDTFQTKQTYENLIEEGLSKFIITICELSTLYDIIDLSNKDINTEFWWDDSIIQDTEAKRDGVLKLLNQGLYSKKRAIMEILEVSEKEALDLLAEIQEESANELPDLEEMGKVGKIFGAKE